MGFERSEEIQKNQTPEKGHENLLQLLSNLEGLTPAGLEHLLATQDRMASTANAKRLTKDFADLDVLSKKASENPQNCFSGFS